MSLGTNWYILYFHPWRHSDEHILGELIQNMSHSLFIYQNPQNDIRSNSMWPWLQHVSPLLFIVFCWSSSKEIYLDFINVGLDLVYLVSPYSWSTWNIWRMRSVNVTAWMWFVLSVQSAYVLLTAVHSVCALPTPFSSFHKIIIMITYLDCCKTCDISRNAEL